MSTWDQTTQGQSIRSAWENLMDTYTTKVPGHAAQLRTLANKPISG